MTKDTGKTKKQPFRSANGSLIPADLAVQQIIAAQRPSLGIFGSLSSHIFIRNPGVAESLNLQAQATFRTLTLVKPDTKHMLMMLLKAEGFTNYRKLASNCDRFLTTFTEQKNKQLYGNAASESEFIDRVTEQLVLRDIRLVVRLAVLLRDQEWRGYRQGHYKYQKKQYKFEPMLNEKTISEKEQDLQMSER